jgi:glycosyltransferase involved in cell wall biosynthesis
MRLSCQGWHDGRVSAHSILVGVYALDDAQHLAQALDSLLAQTVTSDDIVLSVDGPITGQLADTVARYAAEHPSIRPVFLPDNVGQGRAYARTLPECRHEIVFRMDADDICVPDRCERQLRYLDEHPEVALLSATLAEFEGDVGHIVSYRRVPAAHPDILVLARRWNPINQPAAVFRKSAALAVGGYRHMPRFEDYDLWVRMLAAGYRAGNIADPLVYYRLDAANLDRRRSWPATKSAWRFHLWKQRIGFAGPLDTAYALAILTGAFLTPGPVYRWVYRRARR